MAIIIETGHTTLPDVKEVNSVVRHVDLYTEHTTTIKLHATFDCEAGMERTTYSKASTSVASVHGHHSINVYCDTTRKLTLKKT